VRASTPLVVIFKSDRKLSVFAWVRFPRSRFKAEKLTAAGGDNQIYVERRTSEVVLTPKHDLPVNFPEK
jgi:hypothetical protein